MRSQRLELSSIPLEIFATLRIKMVTKTLNAVNCRACIILILLNHDYTFVANENAAKSYLFFL